MTDYKNHGNKPIEFCGDQEGWIAVGSLSDDSPNSPCYPRVVLLGVGLGPSGKEHPSNIAAMLTIAQATDLRERLTEAMGVDRPAPTPTPAPGLDIDAVEAAHARMTAGEWYVHVLPTSPASGLLVFDVGPSDDHPVATTSGTDTESVDEAEANAAGIVALKNAAPAMFAEVRAARAKVEALNAELAAARGTVGGLLATAPDLSADEGQYVADRIGLTYELSTDAGRGRAIKAMRAAEEIIARGPLPKGG